MARSRSEYDMLTIHKYSQQWCCGGLLYSEALITNNTNIRDGKGPIELGIGLGPRT